MRVDNNRPSSSGAEEERRSGKEEGEAERPVPLPEVEELPLRELLPATCAGRKDAAGRRRRNPHCRAHA